MIETFNDILGGYSPLHWIYAAFVIFAAGFLRGFTGFGFGLLVVPALTLFLEPRDVVPAVLVIAGLVGLQLLRKIWRQADWPSVGLLAAGAVVGMPVGIWLLAALPADPMRAVIGAVCLAAVLLLMRGFRLKTMPGTGVRLWLGVVSGLINGGTAMGGPPVIIFFLALPSAVAVGRASLLMFFFASSLIGVAMQGAAGLMTGRVLALALLMLPFMALGNGLGDRWFDKAAGQHYRRVALWFLLAIAMAAVGRALLGAAG